MTRRLPPYLGILAALIVVPGAVAAYLLASGHGGAGWGVITAANVLVSLWLAWGLWVWRHVAWVNLVGRVALLTLAAQLLATAGTAAGATSFVTLVLGAWGMGVAFMLGLALLRLAFAGSHPVLGVARTMFDEAIRQKVGLIFVVILVVLVPLLPVFLNDSRLEYRVSNFLRYSLFVTGLLLSIMTILLCTRSVAREVESKVVFTTLTKPIARWQHLLGKWVGAMALNALLLTVAGVGIYAFTKAIAQQPAQDPLDAVAVQDEILTARIVHTPDEAEPGMLARDIGERLERLRQLEPDFYMTTDPVSGQVRPIPFEQLPENLRVPLQAEVVSDWLSVPPRSSRVYRFSGLTGAAEYGRFVQLRFKPEAKGAAPPDKRMQLWFRANGRDLDFYGMENGQLVSKPMPRFAEDKFAVIRIPVEMIGDDGVLDLEVFNGGRGAPDQPRLAFNPAEGMELLYTVGGFEFNLVKAMFVLWVRLMFVAMLGICAATFLGFPTACLLCGLVFAAAAASGYLAESLDQYGAFANEDMPLWGKIIGVPTAFIAKLGEGEYYDAFKVIIRTIGEVFTAFVPALSEYNPAPMLAEGRAVTTDLIGRSLLWVGGVWTGALALIAAALYHRRELAHVQV